MKRIYIISDYARFRIEAMEYPGAKCIHVNCEEKLMGVKLGEEDEIRYISGRHLPMKELGDLLDRVYILESIYGKVTRGVRRYEN